MTWPLHLFNRTAVVFLSSNNAVSGAKDWWNCKIRHDLDKQDCPGTGFEFLVSTNELGFQVGKAEASLTTEFQLFRIMKGISIF